MKMRSGTIKKIASVLVIALVLTILPMNALSIKASSDEVCGFEDNRFVKSDAEYYIRIKDVTDKGAEVIIYEGDPAVPYYWYNYQPAEDKKIYDMNMAFEAVPSDFCDSEIPECIDECLRMYSDSGVLTFYLNPDGQTMYVRNSSSDYEGSAIEGEYWMVHHGQAVTDTRILTTKDLELVETETVITPEPCDTPVPGDTPETGETMTDSRLPGMEIPLDGDWRIPETTDYQEITIYDDTWWDGFKQETIHHEEKDFGVIWEHTVSEIGSCCYIRLFGNVRITDADILDEAKYKQYHLFDRKPTQDSTLGNGQDPDNTLIIDARKEAFSDAEGLIGPCEMMIYFDSEKNCGFTGMYLGAKSEYDPMREVTLSTGDQKVFYKFPDIDWCATHNSTASQSFDEKTGTMRLTGTSYPPVYDDDEGICDKLEYDLTLKFVCDETTGMPKGSVVCTGNIYAYGEGTEKLTYEIFNCAATSMETAKEYDVTDIFTPIVITAEWDETRNVPDSGRRGGQTTYTPEPTDETPEPTSGAIPTTEPEEPGACPVASPIIIKGMEYVTVIKKIKVKTTYDTFYNDWPDDTDDKNSTTRKSAPTGTIYGYDPANMDEDTYLKLAEENGAMSSSGASVDVNNMTELLNSHIMSTSASSELSESSGTHKSSYLVDGNLSTAWVEGMGDCGEGESFSVTFDSEVSLAAFSIANGYFKSQDLYNKNGKIKTLSVSFDDGSSETFSLTDSLSGDVTNYEYSDLCPFDTVHNTKTVTFTIEYAVPGSKYSDTCVSELQFYVQ